MSIQSPSNVSTQLSSLKPIQFLWTHWMQRIIPKERKTATREAFYYKPCLKGPISLWCKARACPPLGSCCIVCQLQRLCSGLWWKAWLSGSFINAGGSGATESMWTEKMSLFRWWCVKVSYTRDHGIVIDKRAIWAWSENRNTVPSGRNGLKCCQC